MFWSFISSSSIIFVDVLRQIKYQRTFQFASYTLNLSTSNCLKSSRHSAHTLCVLIGRKYIDQLRMHMWAIWLGLKWRLLYILKKKKKKKKKKKTLNQLCKSSRYALKCVTAHIVTSPLLIKLSIFYIFVPDQHSNIYLAKIIFSFHNLCEHGTKRRPYFENIFDQ